MACLCVYILYVPFSDRSALLPLCVFVFHTWKAVYRRVSSLAELWPKICRDDGNVWLLRRPKGSLAVEAKGTNRKDETRRN